MSKQPTTIVLQTNATHVINTSIYQYTLNEQTTNNYSFTNKCYTCYQYINISIHMSKWANNQQL